MSRQTTNYGLTKPDYTDTADIEVVNSNMDIIDEALKVINTKSNNYLFSGEESFWLLPREDIRNHTQGNSVIIPFAPCVWS